MDWESQRNVLEQQLDQLTYAAADWSQLGPVNASVTNAFDRYSEGLRAGCPTEEGGPVEPCLSFLLSSYFDERVAPPPSRDTLTVGPLSKVTDELDRLFVTMGRKVQPVPAGQRLLFKLAAYTMRTIEMRANSDAKEVYFQCKAVSRPLSSGDERAVQELPFDVYACDSVEELQGGPYRLHSPAKTKHSLSLEAEGPSTFLIFCAKQECRIQFSYSLSRAHASTAEGVGSLTSPDDDDRNERLPGMGRRLGAKLRRWRQELGIDDPEADKTLRTSASARGIPREPSVFATRTENGFSARLFGQQRARGCSLERRDDKTKEIPSDTCPRDLRLEALRHRRQAKRTLQGPRSGHPLIGHSDLKAQKRYNANMVNMESTAQARAMREKLVPYLERLVDPSEPTFSAPAAVCKQLDRPSQPATASSAPAGGAASAAAVAPGPRTHSTLTGKLQHAGTALPTTVEEVGALIAQSNALETILSGTVVARRQEPMTQEELRRARITEDFSAPFRKPRPQFVRPTRR